MNCYDSSSDKFICSLQKLNCVFADQVYSEYKKKRYGIKTCNTTKDVSSLKELADYIMTTMDLSGFSDNTYRNEIINNNCLQYNIDNGCASEFHAKSLEICNVSNIIEKINSL